MEMLTRFIRSVKEDIAPAVLNSYSVVFFFNRKFLASVLLIITFFNFWAGLSGLISVLTVVLVADRMGFDKTILRQGVYSFNALLTGIGLGTFFEPGAVYFVVLLLAALFSLMLSVVMNGWLSKYGLPFLSIPFVISVWLILLPSVQFTNLGLTQRNIFWMNELYAIGGKPLLDFFQTIESLPLNKIVIVYLRSLSSIFFQDNLLAGILIALALLFSSRIAFLLSVTGFISAWLFAHFLGADMASFSFYNVGANYILVAIAIGGYFTIPSRYSFLWAVLLVPLTSLILLFMRRLPGTAGLPLFSLPFSVITIVFVYFLILRVKPGKLVLTPVQHYSPEINLYTYINNSDRLSTSKYFPLHLPVWGEWTVSQGYSGKFTHKGDWSKAIDLVITDELLNTHGIASKQCENYYCYNKPVVAPADGYIVDIVDNIDDNEPGKVNTGQNWGNTVTIRHLNDLHTQLCHLRAGSFKVRKGDFVKRGNIIALCGNSGRSPEPHLHFQAQITPLHGAKTLEYPFAYYLQKLNGRMHLKSFSVPSEGDIISNLSTDQLLLSAFDFVPGSILKFKYTNGDSVEKTASWEVFTDAWNSRYFYCSETHAVAYFINDGTMFYFTAFYGDQKSLLYYFYLTAYKVLLGYYPNIEITDSYPLHIIRKNRISLWIHDLISPFCMFIHAKYSIKPVWSDASVNPSKIRLLSGINVSSFNNSVTEGTGIISLEQGRIKEFSFESTKTTICAQSSDLL
jgi:urea transporter/murein DD-endopeptidase MepM/ murein hydrolase activator NlpD